MKMKRALLLLTVAFLAFDKGFCQRRARKVKATRFTSICPEKCECWNEVLAQDSSPGVLVNCTRRKLKRFPYPLPSSTTTLLLDRNKISEIRSEDFRSVKNLRTLNLEGNRLRKLQLASFGILPSLTNLNLRKNRISEIQFGFLRNTAGVRILNLANNRISSLHYAMFDIVDHLQVLDLSHNNISLIEDGTFLGLKRLQSLLLNNNKIKRVTAQLFPDVYSLKFLNLNRNLIDKVEPRGFERQNVLEVLSMIDNQLTKVSYAMLTGLKSLKNLYLQRNRISEIDPWALTQLKNLEALYLYANRLTAIESNIFVGLGKLRVLHLGINNIRYIADNALIDLRVLTTLYLDSNKLTTISKWIFSGLRQVRDLQLYFNNISFVGKDAFSELIMLNRLVWDIPFYFRQRAEYAYAVGNSLHCDCNALWLRNWLKRTRKSIMTCQSPPALKGVPLITVNDSGTTCERVKVTVSPKRLLVLSGEDATFYCTAKPGASYSWTLNGSALKLDNLYTVNPLGTLLIKAVSKTDVGQYACVATNAAGSSAAAADLYIGKRPVFTVLPEVVDVEEPVKPVIFKCSAKGIPKPKITWFKEELKIRVTSDDSSDYHINSDGALTFLGKRHHITEEGHLIIFNPRGQDEGSYTCVAQNDVGKISHRTSLYVDMSSKCRYSCGTGGVCQPSAYSCVCNDGFRKDGERCVEYKKTTPKPYVPAKRGTGSGTGSGSGSGSGTESGTGPDTGTVTATTPGPGTVTGTSGDGSGVSPEVSGESSGGGSNLKVTGSGSSGVNPGTGGETKPPIDLEESGDEAPTRSSTRKPYNPHANVPTTSSSKLPKKQKKVIDIDGSSSGTSEQDKIDTGSTDKDDTGSTDKDDTGSTEQDKVDTGSTEQDKGDTGSGSGETEDGIVEDLIPKRSKPNPTPVVGYSRSRIRPLGQPPT